VTAKKTHRNRIESILEA